MEKKIAIHKFIHKISQRQFSFLRRGVVCTVRVLHVFSIFFLRHRIFRANHKIYRREMKNRIIMWEKKNEKDPHVYNLASAETLLRRK